MKRTRGQGDKVISQPPTNGIRIVIILILVALALTLASCTAVPIPTTTPAEPIANVATVVVERQTATHTPTVGLALPTATIPLEPSATLTLPQPTTTSTRRPTAIPQPDMALPTRTPSATPDPYLHRVAGDGAVLVSSQGQLAFIQDEGLRVERVAGSGEYVVLGRYVEAATWSPDGNYLVYGLSSTEDRFDEAAIYEQRLWSANDGIDISLSELFSNYPSPPYHVFEAYWSPDSTKILFPAYLDERHEEEKQHMYEVILTTADLQAGTFRIYPKNKLR